MAPSGIDQKQSLPDSVKAVEPVRDSLKPRIRIREELQYEAEIGTRTYLNLEQAQGTIEVIIPEQPRKKVPPTKKASQNKLTVFHLFLKFIAKRITWLLQPIVSNQRNGLEADSKKEKVSVSKPIGYLSIYDYEGTSLVKRLQEDLRSAMIPIYPLSTNRDKPIVFTFNYTLDAQSATIPTRPIFLEAQILDEKDRREEYPTGVKISFHNKLRLRLMITSEANRLTEHSGEPILRKLDEAKIIIENQIQRLKILHRRFRWRKSLPLIKKQNAKKFAYVDRKLQAYQKLLENYDRHHHKKIDKVSSRKILSGLVEEWKTTIKKHHHVTLSFTNSIRKQDEFLLQILKQVDELLQKADERIELAYIEIKAPYIRSYYNDKQLNWHYNPQRQCLEQRGLSLNWNSDTNLYEMTLDLDIDPPIDHIPELEGTLALHFDEPVSDLQVNWTKQLPLKSGKGTHANESMIYRIFRIVRVPLRYIPLKSGGRKFVRSVPTCLRSYEGWLILDFTIALDEIFSERSFMPLRQLHFEGVIPHPHHIANIENILSNHRLTVLPRGVTSQQNGEFTDQNNDRDEEKEFSDEIVAVRQGAYEDIIVVKITGRSRRGKHTIFYNDKQEQLEEDITLGTLDIDLTALMRRSSKEINDLLNAIQLDLEQYFITDTEPIG